MMALFGKKQEREEMAQKPATATEEKPQASVPATTNQGGAPAFLNDKTADAGQGVSSAQDDNLVPLIYVLQTNSPQVNDRDEAYIDGARGGAIWLRNAIDPIVKGEDGIEFQPCFFYKDVVEWIPREDGGGFVGRHDVMPKEAKEVPDKKNPKKLVWQMPNGNQLKETRYHVGYVVGRGSPLPYVIPLSGTGHSVSKAWMFMMNSKTNAAGKAYPSYASIFRLTTKMRKNKEGTWFVLEAHDAGFVSSEAEYERGKTLYEAFASGAMRAMQDDQIVDDDKEVEHSETSKM